MTTNKVFKLDLSTFNDLEVRLNKAYENPDMADFKLCAAYLTPPTAPTHLMLIFQKEVPDPAAVG